MTLAIETTTDPFKPAPQMLDLNDIEMIADEISTPVRMWPGNCHAIATGLLRRFPIEGSRLSRGLWQGPIHRKSLFAGRPFTGHSWLTLADGRILDPTRFAFEMNEPYIYLGFSDHYDEAGLERYEYDRPSLPGERNVPLTEAQEKALTVPGLLPLKGAISTIEVNWLAHRPIHPRSAEIYTVIAEIGLKSLIPIDAWNIAKEPEKLAAKMGNRGWYAVPEAAAISDTKALSMLVQHFLHPDKNGKVWKWAEEDGPGLLNTMGPMDCLENLGDKPLTDLSQDDASFLCELGMEFLGVGNAKAVERFADKMGIGAKRIDDLLQKLGDRAGMIYRW